MTLHIRKFQTMFLGVVAAMAVGCGAQYSVATCAFGSDQSTCSAGQPLDSPRGWLMYHFTLVNPNPGIPPGCTGELSLDVNTRESGAGKAHWHASERDATTCNPVGEEFEGSTDVTGGKVFDVFFPHGNFTFRIQVNEQ